MEELVKNEFQFYAKLAKPLVLNLPKSKDRILAAAWIKKFGQEAAGTEKLRTSYLKLLLFCLQRRRLTGIFADDPSFYEFLEELPEEIDLNDFARNLLEQESSERKAVIKLEMMGDMENFPAYTTDCSPDLTEYVAAQDIPNFGVHAYYAISKQPVNKWQRADKAILPKGTKSSIDTSITASRGGATSICVCTPKGTASAPQVEEGAAVADCLLPGDKTPSPSPKKKRRSQKKFGVSPPTHPIGEVKHSTEDRITPTWGTNLLEVRDTTDIGQIEEASDEAKALDKQVSEMIQDEEEEAAAEDAAPPPQETVASKAKDMLSTIDEFSSGKMKKPKQIPKRLLSRMGDTSGIKTPKSLKQPSIPVKGMKKKGGKKGIGPRPANLPEEYAEWTEKDLEEAGLTWKDLLPVEENIDDELQRIEDEEMKGGPEEDLDIEEIAYTPYEDLDLDAMIRAAEADLAATVYETGIEADENAIEQLADEMYDIQDEINASAASEDARTASPAIASGIPVTTPQRSPSPRRSRSPEKVFDDLDDALLRHRESPLRPPRVSSADKRRKRSPRRKASPPTDKDPNISRVYEKVKKVAEMDDSFLEHEREFEEIDEFERLESQFQQETGSPRRGASPARGVSFSPGEADRVRQRVREQEQLLRTPQARSPARQVMRTPERIDQQFDLGGVSPFMPAESPPLVTQQERYDILMSLPETPDTSLGLLSPSVFQSPAESSGDASLGLLSPSVFQTPPAERERLPAFLMGSPIANQIIGEASNCLADDILAGRLGDYLDDVTPPRGDLSYMSASPGPSDYHTADESLGLLGDMPDELVPGGGVDDRTIFDSFRPQGAPTRAAPPIDVIRPPCPARSPMRQPSPSPIRAPSPSPQLPPTPPPMPFFPGISAPITPIRQRPIPRPTWYGTPRPRPETPPRQYGPERRPYFYWSPEPPLIDPFDPLAYPDQPLLEAEEVPEAFGDVSIESPRDVMTPRRRRPPPLQVTPSGRPAQALRPTQLFGTPSEPCEPCTGTSARSPVGPPGRQPEPLSPQLDRRKVIFTPPIPPRYVPPPITPEGVAGPSRRRTGETPDLDDSPLPSPPREQRFPPARRIKKIGRYPPSPTSDEEFERLEKQFRDQDSPCVPCSPARVASPMGGIPPDVTAERVRQQEAKLLRPSPIRSPSPVLDRRKVISTPPRPPKYVFPQPPVQLWKTPEGVAGPSRRRTGFTPPVVCPSDCTPGPSPELETMLPPARRVIKKGVYSPSLMTPTGERYVPSPYEEPAQRVPPCGTPGRGDPRMIPRRLFDTPGRRPVMAVEGSPIQYSPSPVCSPIVDPYEGVDVPHLDAESPPAHMPPTPPPLLKPGQLYFPTQDVLPTLTPEQLPSWEDIERHPVVPDYLHAQVSQRTPFGRGPGRYIHRESVRAFPPMDRIPEYLTNVDQILDPECPSRLGYPLFSKQPVRVKVPKYYEPLPRDFPSPRPQSPIDYSPPPEDIIRDISTAGRDAASYYPDVIQSSQELMRAIEQYDVPCDPCSGGAPVRPPRPSGIRPPSGMPMRPSGIRPPSGPPMRPSGLRPPSTGSQSRLRPPSGTPLARPQMGPQLATPEPTGRPTVPQAAPVKTSPTRRAAEPGRQKSLFGKIQLKETKSTMLRKEALAKQKAAELEIQKKKEKKEQAKRNRKKKLEKERLREIVAQQTAEAEAAAAYEAAARETPGPEFMDLLQQHEVDFPGMRRAVVVKGRWKKLPRRSESVVEQMDEVQEEPGSPCEPCGGGTAYQDTIRDLRLFDRPEPQYRPPPIRMDQVEQNVLAREREEAEYFEEMIRQQRLEQIEQDVIAREREEAEYFEQLRRAEEARAAAAARQMTEEEQLAEFEALEREFSPHRQAAPQPCPAAMRTPPRLTPATSADRLTYSPPRPQITFGRPPFQPPAQHLPPPCAPMTPPGGLLDAMTPPMYESPPPTFGLEMVSPPAFFDVDFGTPSPQRPYITPPLEPQRVRQEIEYMARPLFDPGLRVDVLPRDDRRVITCPGGFPAVREEDPLIPDLASPPREDPNIRRRKELERIRRRKRPRPPSPDDEMAEMAKFFRDQERDWEFTPDVTPEGAALMDRTPPRRRLPPPMIADQPRPVCPAWEPPAAAPGAMYPFTPPRHTEFYVPPADTRIHPDLVGLDLRTPMREPEVCPGILEEAPDQSLYFTPPQYPEYFESIERERQREREAIEQWQPPRAMTFEHMPSPGELGLLTPPSCGIGPHRETYTPEESLSLGLLDQSMLESAAQGIVSPPLEGLLDSPLLDNVDQGWITTPPAGGGPTEQEIQEFLEPVPILEHPGSLVELRYRTERAAGRAGIRPRPMFFGGYGETPKRYIPRWYSHGGKRNLIRELDEVASPPTPGTPPPQFPEPPPTWSPGLDEFERMEREMEQSVPRGSEFEERRRRMIIDDMAEEAERNEMARRDAMRREAERQDMEFRQPYSPCMPQIPSPSRTPVGRPPTPVRISPPRAGPPQAESPCDTGTCNVAESEEILGGMLQDAAAERWLEQLGTPQNISDSILDVYQTPPQLSPVERLTRRPRSPGYLLDQADLDEYQSPMLMSQPASPIIMSPPSPASPMFMMQPPSPSRPCIPQTSPDILQSPPPRWEQMAATVASTPHYALDHAFLEGYQSPPSLSQPVSPSSPPCTPQNLSDNYLDLYETPPQLSPWEQMALTAARTPNFLDDAVLEEFQSPPSMAQLDHQYPCQSRTPLTPGQRAALEAQQDREIQEMFGASPTPASPGPGPDFMVDVYSHHVPSDFREGMRPPCVVRDQIGSRDVRVNLPRHTPGPDFDPIMEQRVQFQSPLMEFAPRRRPPRPVSQPPIRAGRAPAAASNAQRIAETRRQYLEQTRISQSQQRQQEQQPAATTSCPSPVCSNREPFGGLVPRQVQQRMPAPQQQVEAEDEGPRRVVRKTSSVKKIKTKRN